MKNYIIILIMFFGLTACSTSRPVFMVENGQQLALNHKRVAILPFAVTFSDTYKKMMRSDSWPEQERVAGIDLQKTTFAYFAKRANKKNFELIILDQNSVNKTLLDMGIPYSHLIRSDKSNLAAMLGVDAVIFGHSFVEFDINRGYMGTNGVRTVMELYDNFTGQKIWAAEETEYIRNRFDSPQDVAGRSVGNLIDRLPYQKR